MFEKIALSLGLGLGLLAGVDAAHAGCITFERDCLVPDIKYSMGFTGSDGLGATATATAGSNTAKVFRDIFGLGVKSGHGDNTMQVDIQGPDEFLFITFDVPVIIKSIVFTNVGCDDDFKLFADGNQVASGSLHVNGHLGELLDLGTTKLDFNFGPITELGFTALDRNDGYKVKKICYDQATAIPLPAAAWSGLSGLGMMGLFAAKRKLRQLA